MVANSVDEITIFPKENDDNAPYEIQDSGGTALTDADSVEDEFQVTLSVGDNTIKVEVTAEDGSTQTYTVTVTRAAGDTDGGRHGVEVGADGDGAGRDRGHLHGGPRQPSRRRVSR